MNWSHHSSCDMGQRNMLSKLQMHDLNSDLVELQFLPAPSSVVNSVTGCPIAGIHPSLSSTGPFPHFDVATYPDNRDSSSMVHGNLFNDFHSPDLRLELDGPPDAGFHTHQYLAPPFAHGHGSSSSDVLPSNNINKVVELNLNEDPRMGQYVDNERRPSKRKFAEGSGSGHCYVNKFAGSSSSSKSVTGPSAPVLDALIERGNSSIEKAPSPGLPDTRGCGSLSTIEDGSYRSITCSSQAVSVDLRLAHHFTPEHQGSYVAQSSQPAGITWPEQYNNNVDVGNASWMSAHPLSLSTPGMLAVCGDGLEATSMNGHGYMGAASNMNTGYSNPAPVPYPYEYYSPVQSIPGSGYMGYPPPIAHAFLHPPANLQYGSANPSHGFIESVSVHPITASLSTDVRQSQVISQAPQVIITNPTVSHPPSVDYNSEDDGSSDDEHRDLRMDIDGMSYEELLALEEQIGDVSTGLSEETIAKCMTKRLPTRFNFLSAIDSGKTEKFDETCTICQVQLEEKEMIGVLNCGHEYHAECIRKWLLVKNFCPVCKTPADSSPVKTE